MIFGGTAWLFLDFSGARQRYVSDRSDRSPYAKTPGMQACVFGGVFLRMYIYIYIYIDIDIDMKINMYIDMERQTD